MRFLLPTLLLGSIAAAALLPEEEPRWYRGNTHTHTLWSDGDGAPELVASWYVEHEYDFLVLTDHNLLSEGERWFPIFHEGDIEERLTEERVEDLRRRFGANSVEIRETDGRREMRLLNLEELRGRFEVPGEFLFVQGEEITTSFERHPVHINALNLEQAIYPPKEDTLVATMNGVLDLVQEQEDRTGRPILAHINHPNFGWGITWQQLAQVRGERFFEIYNGHPSVRNAGDAEHPSLEEMWDRALTLRLTELNLGLLYGVATDDSHRYHQIGAGKSNPGRGWVMVRARQLEAGGLMEAMRRGDFYGSSGVTLVDVQASEKGLSIEIEAQDGVAYTTRFLGTRRGSGDGEIGEVLAEVQGAKADYVFTGDELYVRAVVISDRLHPNPYAEGDLEQAWVQPVRPR